MTLSANTRTVLGKLRQRVTLVCLCYVWVFVFTHTHTPVCTLCVYVVMYEYGSLSLSKSISVAFGGRRWEISVACIHVGECGTQGMCHKTQPLPIIFYESQLNFISMGASSRMPNGLVLFVPH